MPTLGVDVSFWNGTVDFAKMRAAGVPFCYAKASQISLDSQFKSYWPAMKAAGLLRGAYHYLDYRSSELVQAKIFTDAMGGDWGELPPVLDFETPLPAGIDAAEWRGRAWNWLQAVEKTTGKVPMIYTGFYYWLQWGSLDAGWAKYPFWLAWYADVSMIKVPPPWKKWTFWQYSGNGNGPQYGSTGLSLDMDLFNGTEAELRAFAGLSTPPPTPPALTNGERITRLENAAAEHGWTLK